MHLFRSVTLLFSVLAIGLSACSVTTTPVPDATTTLALGSPASELLLLDNGLGPFKFQDSGEAVIEGVTATIGGWDADSSDNDALALPMCEHGQARLVSWGSLVLTFVARDGSEEFTGWSYGFDPLTGDSEDNRHLDLATPEGIMLGSLRDDLIEAYGSTVSITDDTVVDTAVFIVAGDTPNQLAGKLDGAGPSGRVDFLETTPNCD